MFEKDIRLRTCLHKNLFQLKFSYFLQIFARLQQNIPYTLLQTRKCMYTLFNICQFNKHTDQNHNPNNGLQMFY